MIFYILKSWQINISRYIISIGRWHIGPLEHRRLQVPELLSLFGKFTRQPLDQLEPVEITRIIVEQDVTKVVCNLAVGGREFGFHRFRLDLRPINEVAHGSIVFNKFIESSCEKLMPLGQLCVHVLHGQIRSETRATDHVIELWIVWNELWRVRDWLTRT